LGPAVLIQLGRQARAGLHPHWRETGLARAVLAGLPAIWHGASLVAAPLAGWPQNWSLTARPVAASDGDMGEFD
jgi:tRNA(Ile)-lysidine synthase